MVLILEGLVPFISPGTYRNMVQQMAAMPENTLRIVGFVLMVMGLVFLLLVRG